MQHNVNTFSCQSTMVITESEKGKVDRNKIVE